MASSVGSTSGTISSLGLGSGTLTSALIDQLKNADNSALVTPIDKRIQKVQTQQKDLATLMTTLSMFKGAASDLGADATYQKRSVSTTTTSSSTAPEVSATVSDGTNPQTLNINVSQLAKNDIYQSSGFSSNTAIVTNKATTMKVKIGNNTDINISVAAGTTLEQLAQQITDSTGSKVVATILNTGSQSNPYKMILKASDTGSTNRITIDSGAMTTGLATPKYAGAKVATSATTTGADGDITINGVAIAGVKTLASNSSEQNAQLFMNAINDKADQTNVYAETDGNGKLNLYSKDGSKVDLTVANNAGKNIGFNLADGTYTNIIAADSTFAANKLQSSQDAKFNLDGIAITRSTNSVADVVSGVTLTLNKTMASTDKVSVAIANDTSNVPKLIDTFVQQYNDMANALSDATKFDASTKVAGTFQGVSDIVGISSKVNTIIFSQDSKGRSLTDYGFSIDKNGQISVDQSALGSKLSADPTALKEFFNGNTSVTAASYTAKRAANIPSKDTRSATGDISINGVDIGPVTSLKSNTAEQNAQLFVTTINENTAITGVTASTDGNGKLVLTNKSGGNIQIKSNLQGATLTGLSSSAAAATAMSLATVASGKSTSTDGVFKQLNTYMQKLIVGSSSALGTFDASLTTSLTNENKAKQSAVDRITSKYQTMSAQFAAYDSMINKYQQIGNTLTQQINAATKSNG